MWVLDCISGGFIIGVFALLDMGCFMHVGVERVGKSCMEELGTAQVTCATVCSVGLGGDWISDSLLEGESCCLLSGTHDFFSGVLYWIFGVLLLVPFCQPRIH